MRRKSNTATEVRVGVAIALVFALAIAVVAFGVAFQSGESPPTTEPNETETTSPPPEGASGDLATPGTREAGGGGESGGLELVAHEPLLDEHQYVGDESFGIPRGSNGEITVADDCLYVGSVVGYQPPLVVDVSNPRDPSVVGPVPDAVPGVGNGIEGIEASGDVLVIDHRKALGGLSFEVPEGLPERGLSVWDISGDCRTPELVARYDTGDTEVHATRLWRDPADPDRLLAVQTDWDSPTVRVVDLRGCPASCDPEVVAEWDLEAQTGVSGASHEAIMSTDGQRIYVAQPDVGFLLLDSSALVSSLRGDGDCDPAPPTETPGTAHCLTVANPEVERALDRHAPFDGGFPHTLFKIPDRPYFMAIGESGGPDWSAGNRTARMGQCPGSSVRIHAVEGAQSEDGAGNRSGAIEGPLDPDPVGTYSLPEQRLENCTAERWKPGTVEPPGWFSPHFPTAFPDLVFLTYYGQGLRAVDISDPTNPREVDQFVNEPVDDVRWAYHGANSERVFRDDGRALRQPHSNATHPFAFSYPVFVDGYLLYADSQSGLYVLEYAGPHADQIPENGTCLPANPGAVEPGYGPCPPYGQTDWGESEARSASSDGD